MDKQLVHARLDELLTVIDDTLRRCREIAAEYDDIELRWNADRIEKWIREGHGRAIVSKIRAIIDRLGNEHNPFLLGWLETAMNSPRIALGRDMTDDGNRGLLWSFCESLLYSALWVFDFYEKREADLGPPPVFHRR